MRAGSKSNPKVHTNNITRAAPPARAGEMGKRQRDDEMWTICQDHHGPSRRRLPIVTRLPVTSTTTTSQDKVPRPRQAQSSDRILSRLSFQLRVQRVNGIELNNGATTEPNAWRRNKKRKHCSEPCMQTIIKFRGQPKFRSNPSRCDLTLIPPTADVIIVVMAW